jgi:uncharacterized protein YihD (DUF1040 family)
MRDKARIPEMLKLIEEIWNENPDFRLGQLIVAAAKPQDHCPQVFYLEDDLMKEKLKNLLSLMRTARKNQNK